MTIIQPPPNLYSIACLKFNIIPKIDVCATEKNSKCAKFITEKEDSLLVEWKQTFFMNPPYSKVEKFMKKAYYQHIKHGVEGLILVFAKTDTKWWHEFVENKAEVHFIKGRIKFFKDGYETKNSAPYPSVWLIYRVKQTKELSNNDLTCFQ